MADQLNINQATIGYDRQGTENFLDNVHSNVIVKTTDALSDSLNDLLAQVQGLWSGKSEQIFEGNMTKDFEDLKTALLEAEKILKSEVYSIGSAMIDADNKLVKDNTQEVYGGWG